MQRNIRVFFLFLAVLIAPALCQASSIILTRTSPNHIVTSGSDEQVYGTSSSNEITLESGAKAELINFPGQNVIDIQAAADGFTVYRSGTIVTFQGTDGTLLKIPATQTAQIIDFTDRSSLTLSIHNGQVLLDDQLVTAAAAAIDVGQGGPVACGAYVAPGVWKEFDCYNLAAIGKTTDDDPFTPSWRLLGGFWQWGRKGPDPSEWYDTNTEHFAHGPTGPGESEANSGEISGWDQTDAPDDSWSAKSMAVYYLLDQDADLLNTDIDGDGIVDLLANININGLRFRVDGREELLVEFDQSLLISKDIINHEDFVAALQNSLENLIAQGKVPVDTTLKLYHTLPKFFYLDDWSQSSDIPAIVLETQTDTILEVVGFNWVYGLEGEYNVDGRIYDKTGIEDPCPFGFRVPTISQWQGVIENNTQTAVGTWPSGSWDDNTNYKRAFFFGDKLMLPYAGIRGMSNGVFKSDFMGFRDYAHSYWSRSASNGGSAWTLLFTSGYVLTNGNHDRQSGYSLRCIADESTICNYRISPSSGSFSSDSQSASVSITASRSSCSWKTSGNLSWVSLSPSNGIGNESVTITVDENTGAARSGSVTIADQTYTITQVGASMTDGCGAYVAPGVWKEFDCYNLAAIGKTTYDSPFTPSWRLIGGYWQWGRKGPDPSEWYDTNTEHFAHGPTSSYVEGANIDPISGWSSTDAPEGAWSDYEKTSNDPCPAGFRVPSKSQWDGVVENNNKTAVGTWDSDDTNYSSARFFGDALMLPAAGERKYTLLGGSGELSSRGSSGYYWSSSGDSSFASWQLSNGSGVPTTFSWFRTSGFSVRCVAE